MAVKDWIPVAQDIYDALIEDGNPIQGKTLKISHKDLCEILDKHCVSVTETMNKHVNMFVETSNLVGIIESTVKCKNLSKPLYENGLFKGDLTDAEERLAYSSYNISKSMWVYQIAHKLQLAFKDPVSFYEDEYEEEQTEDQEVEENRAKEEAVKDEEEKEIVNEDIEFVEDNSFDEPSDYPKVHVCKTDYDKIICKLGAVKLSLGVVSLSDVVKVIGEEMLPNVRGKDSFTQIIPGDPRFINVLDIMNKIVSTINLNYQDNRIAAVSILKRLLSDLEGTIKSLDSKPNQNDTEKCNKVCDYLLGLKSKNDSSLECLTIPAFFDVMMKFDIIESDEEILKKLQENPMINIVFFELIKSVKTLEGKPTESWYESTSRLVLQFKNFYNLVIKPATKFSFPNTMTINPLYGTNAKAKDIPGIDPQIYQKAAAFDRIVEALRPVFIELEKQKPLMQGLNGWGSPFNMNSMFRV